MNDTEKPYRSARDTAHAVSQACEEVNQMVAEATDIIGKITDKINKAIAHICENYQVDERHVRKVSGNVRRTYTDQ